MWFTENHANKIANITPAGQVSEYTLPVANQNPWGIAAGPDGNLWFTTSTGAIGRSTPSGAISEFPTRGCDGANPDYITAGTDSSMWFGEACGGVTRIGRMSTSGVLIAEYSIPQPDTYNAWAITAGPDGNVWFVEDGGDPQQSIVARITPGGDISQFYLPPGSHARGIAAGSDGNLWVTDVGLHEVDMVSRKGAVTTNTLASGGEPSGIAAGPSTDSASVWFADESYQVGRVGLSVPAGFPAAEGQSFNGPVATFSDSDGNTAATAYSATIAWGDRRTSPGRVTGVGPFTVAGTHTYAEEGTYAVSVKVQDADGATFKLATSGHVSDALLSAAGTTVQMAGASVNGVLATFTDADPSAAQRDYVATIAWGDGSTSKATIAAASGTFTVSGSHTYARKLSHRAMITLTDSGGSVSGAASLIVGPLTEHPLPLAASAATNLTQLTSVTAGPDGNLWFTDDYQSVIGRLSPGGAATDFPAPTASMPHDIVAGPDGNLWFTEFNGTAIGRVTPAGIVSIFKIVQPQPTCAPYGSPTYLARGITAGPDGNLWFTESCPPMIGRVTPAGDITQFPIPNAPPDSDPTAITQGPDGNLWFTEPTHDNIWRVSPSGVFTSFAIPAATAGPTGIASGSDGNLWFTEDAVNRIGRISTSGVFTEFAIPTPGSEPDGIVAAADGNLWFTELAAARIARITTGGVVTEYPLTLTTDATPIGIALGPPTDGGALWFTENWDQMGRFDPTRA